MNRARIEKLRDALLAPVPPAPLGQGLGFNMHYWRCSGELAPPDTSGRGCGTTACLAGWTVSLFATAQQITELQGEAWMQTGRMAGSMLKLMPWQADELFTPKTNKFDFSSDQADTVTPAMAARVLDHLLATGDVDWSVAFPQVQP